jgi:hypothetical protein
MHESGLIRRLLQVAMDEAARRGGTLAAVHVRLGALAGGSPDHLREHFAIEARRLGMALPWLNIEEDPDSPTGVEITAIEVEPCAADS